MKTARETPVTLGETGVGTEAESVTSPRNASPHGYTLRVPCLHPLGKHWCFEHLLFAVWTWSQANVGISGFLLGCCISDELNLFLCREASGVYPSGLICAQERKQVQILD